MRARCASPGIDMSMRTIAASSSNMNSASARGSVFDAGRPENSEGCRADDSDLKSGAGAANRVGDGVDRFVLPDDAGAAALPS